MYKPNKPAKNAPSYKVIEVTLDKIHISPGYRALFDPPEPSSLWNLSDQFERNPSMPTPVEIAPDGTLVVGEDYVQAAKKANLDRILALAWDELSGPLVEIRTIAVELRRDGHGSMAQGRCVRRSTELVPDVPQDWRGSISTCTDLVQALEMRFGVGTRTACQVISSAARTTRDSACARQEADPPCAS